MTAFLFPGQGSQQPGAAHLFVNACPNARAVVERAQTLLPDAVFQIMRDGPRETLNDTRNAQPALVCAEMAASAYLAHIGITPEICAGHSLGEISALAAAGALSFEQALPLVGERARLMSENVPEGGMAAVLGLPPETIAEVLPENAQIANYNGPAQTIISGTKDALAEAAEGLKQAGAKRVLPLPVSGPFHSRFMSDAADALARYLADVDVLPPTVAFLSSVSGEYETDPARIKLLLAEQLVSPVRWTRVMEQLSGRQAIEVGPGAVLQGLAKRMSNAPAVRSADSPEACDRLLLDDV